MDEIIDIIWFKILDGIDYIVKIVDTLIAPLNILGPAAIIFLIVLVMVCITKFLSKAYTTKRYLELQEKYKHWLALRQEALACEDRAKGKALAKNIDQAELNKAYYDYFFEGFLKNIITTIFPVLITAAYVIKSYNPDKLMENFGRNYIFKFSNSGSEPIIIGALFWFVISLFLVHLVWFLTKTLVGKYAKASP